MLLFNSVDYIAFVCVVNIACSLLRIFKSFLLESIGFFYCYFKWKPGSREKIADIFKTNSLMKNYFVLIFPRKRIWRETVLECIDQWVITNKYVSTTK